MTLLYREMMEMDSSFRFGTCHFGNLKREVSLTFLFQIRILSGTLKEFAKKQEIDETRLLSILRSLDLDREQFVKNMEEFSEGQKKKVLIAASLLTPAHLYLWDEPLNYIDVFSRMQIEKLIAQFQPTMLIVEHDARFAKKLATKVVDLSGSV